MTITSPSATTEKIGVSIDRRVLQDARAYAEQEGVSLSAWLTVAARRAVTRRRAAEYVAWEQAHLPADFMAEAEAAALANTLTDDLAVA